MVVSPKIGTNTLDEAKELGIDNIFFQPGTYNDEILKKSEDLGFIYVIDCVYAILRQRE
jgi:hypothetical protein